MPNQSNIRFKGRIKDNICQIEILVKETKTYTDCGDFEYHEKFDSWHWRPPQDIDLFDERTTRVIFQELRKLNQNIKIKEKLT